jgi:hypothetical protein
LRSSKIIDIIIIIVIIVARTCVSTGYDCQKRQRGGGRAAMIALAVEEAEEGADGSRA